MEQLKIYQRQYDLILYATPIINRFPKNQRFVLGQQVQNCMMNIAKMIIEANKTRNRLPKLYQIDIELEKFRMLIRLAKDLRFLSVKQYGLIAEGISEIGRMLGGWIKQTQTPSSR